MYKQFLLQYALYIVYIVGFFCLYLHQKIYKFINNFFYDDKNIDLIQYASNFIISFSISAMIFGLFCLIFGQYIRELENEEARNTIFKSKKLHNKQNNNKQNHKKYKIHTYNYVNGKNIYNGMVEI